MRTLENNNSYLSFCKPKLSELLQSLGLDKTYTGAEGNYLYTDSDEIITDFIGGFGATLAGHNNPVLKKVMIDALLNNIPIHAQVSLRNESGDLAKKLNEVTPGTCEYYSCFTNSGTESVEAALKHAYKVHFDKVRKEYEKICRVLNDFYYQVEGLTDKIELPGKKKLIDFRDDIDEYNLAQFEAFQDQPAIIAFKGAFHGKTTSSLKVTFNKSYREGFQGLSALNTIFIDPLHFHRIPEIKDEHKCTFYYPILINNTVELKPFQITKVIALIFEPILGEGGIIPLPDATLSYLASNHEKNDIPYIIDEIQSGCGRTGSFYYFEQTPLLTSNPEYILLSKALGGGLVKIGAVLIRKNIYDHDFGILHTSTFGEDGLSAAVSSAFVDWLHAEDKSVMKQIVRKGNDLKNRLNALKKEFPTIIKDVRGKGLMLAVEFTDLEASSPFFRLSGKQGILSLLIASYLLEYHKLRIMAPLTTMLKGNPGKKRMSVVRIQPSADISEKSIDDLITGLKEVLSVIANNNEYCLIAHLMGTRVDKKVRDNPKSFANEWPIVEEERHIDSRIGFLIHPTTIINLTTYFFPSMNYYSLDALRIKEWWNRICRFLEPVHVKSDYISSNDFVIESNLILVPFLPEYIIRDMQPFILKEIRDKTQDAVIIAKELGDENIPLTMVGLGAYTSIATNNGLTLNDYEMCITTGNAFTSALTILGIFKAAESRSLNLRHCTVSIVGASGNIGQVLSRILALYVGKLNLLGSSKKGSLERLEITRNICLKEISKNITLDEQADNTEIGDLAKSILQETENAEKLIVSTTDSACLKTSDIIVIATNSDKESLITPDMVKHDAIICCTSVPSNLDPSIASTAGILAFDGGLAKLPEDSSVRFVGFPESGMTYGCLAETLLLGFEGYNHSFAKGILEPSQIYACMDWAKQYNFSIGDLCLNGKKVL